MTRGERVAATLAVAAAGFLGGLFGVGGGLILVPLLTGPLHRTQHQAHATSLAVIVFTALAAGATYALHGNVDWTTGLWVGAASIVTAPLGAKLTGRFSNTRLRVAFSVFLLLVAVRLLWTPHGGAVVEPGWPRTLVSIAIGIVAGLMAGFMGVGGGIVAVPAFRLLLGMTQQLAQGTSLLMILGAASSGSIEHARRGNLVPQLVPWLAFGAVVTSPLSSWSAQHLPQTLLPRAFALFLIVNGVQGLVRARRSANREAKQEG